MQVPNTDVTRGPIPSLVDFWRKVKIRTSSIGHCVPHRRRKKDYQLPHNGPIAAPLAYFNPSRDDVYGGRDHDGDAHDDGHADNHPPCDRQKPEQFPQGHQSIQGY